MKKTAKKIVQQMLDTIGVDTPEKHREYLHFDQAKRCAIVCVEQIQQALGKADTAYDLIPELEYWAKVKKEIEKIK